MKGSTAHSQPSVPRPSPADVQGWIVRGYHSRDPSVREHVRHIVATINDGRAVRALLQAQGLAACTVSHTSACIGQAASTLADGVVSHANAAATALGIRTGLALAPQLDALTRRHP